MRIISSLPHSTTYSHYNLVCNNIHKAAVQGQAMCAGGVSCGDHSIIVKNVVLLLLSRLSAYSSSKFLINSNRRLWFQQS